jgi:N-acetyltransferase
VWFEDIMPKRTYGRIYSPTIETDQRTIKRRRVESSLDSRPSSYLSPGSSSTDEEHNGTLALEKSPLTPESCRQVVVDTSTSDSFELSGDSPPLLTTIKTRKPIFSFLHKKASSSISTKSKQMKQLTLDLGGPPTKTCTECGMTYTLSQKKDVALHVTFHAQKLGNAIKVSAQLLRSAVENVAWKDTGKSERILRITRRDDFQKRKLAEEVLEIVAGDLGAVSLPSTALWCQMTFTPNDQTSGKCDKYQTYLFIKDQMCVGLLLAERIVNARRVQASSPDVVDKASGVICATDERFPATMGICRIWTSSGFRQCGIATRLLDVANSSFQPLLPVRKDLVAFSQPTEKGAILARKWFKRETGWLVYDE